MKKVWPPILAAGLMLLSFFTIKFVTATHATPGPVRPTSPSPDQINAGVLINGDFDQLAFYPRPTNHYVAGQWFEWWGNYLTIPEYIDGGHPYHNECYPSPPDGICHNDATDYYNSSQGYIRWGDPYIAGIYQPISGVTPCTLYEFTIYNRNDTDTYHPKVGIDPTGWQITRIGNSPPENCPPDGQSSCPDPYIASFPSTMKWSEEFDHAAYTWEPGSITAEAVSSTISVWTYTAPEGGVSMSTYWDYGTLTQAPFPDGKLPRPDSPAASSFIHDVVVTKGTTTLTIDWETAEPASTQVWYEIMPYTPPVTSTLLISHTVHLPFVARGGNLNTLSQFTPVDLTPTTQHNAIIEGIQPGDTVSFAPMSRRPHTTACTTEAGLVQTIKFANP